MIKLGSSDAAPGGGAAAAVVIAEAAALGEMVARLNLKRSQKKGLKNALSLKNIALLSAIRREALRLMEDDVRGFLALSKFGKAQREGAAYTKALERAAAAPCRMCLLAEKGIALAASEMPRTGLWVYSDLLESAVLFDAGFRSARLNVEINLSAMKPSRFTARTVSRLDEAAQKIKVGHRVIFQGKKR